MRTATLLWSLALTGCVTTYLPMEGLHRPVALDRRFANFTGARVGVTCVPDAALDQEAARDLCRKLQVMFENQGATVVQARTPFDDAAGEPARGELDVRVSGRLIHRETASWLFWDQVTDYTVAQDITVRDETGFLLMRESLIARFATRLGFTSDAEDRFSKDFYGQVSQIAFDAQQRRRVLREGDAP